MTSRFLRFIAIVTTFLAVTSYYIGSRFIAVSPWAASHAGAVATTLAAFVVLQFAGPFSSRIFPGARQHLVIVHWVTYATLGLYACLLFYTFVADLVVIAVGLLYAPGLIDPIAFGAVLVVVAATLVFGTAQAATGPRVYEVDVPIAGLPADLEGFRLAQVSDLHLGVIIGRRYAARVVRLVNGLQADAVALTGDFVDGTVEELRTSAAELARLQSTHGTYFITGNHEYYWGVAPWLEELRRLGIRALLNEHVVLHHGQAELVLAGVTDQAPEPHTASANAPQDAPKVLLAHHPEGLAEAQAAGFHLQLSGHTHGGQFFPFSVFVRLRHRHYKGLYRVGRLWLYVSRGTGFWGPPLRFGVPAEVTLLRLTRAA